MATKKPRHYCNSCRKKLIEEKMIKTGILTRWQKNIWVCKKKECIDKFDR